ncbi:hypothetical protein BF93_16565 [Brachybacterium phenoliresistens]|uniref:Uncharacterized protein n=1 Tax=Brachybacterium phenoliresistens TaxID=396014 RepID=Z9JU53_9MICO|nr:hypothetical protein [Brachybacterium phenoliresistens]EWS81513.1 hypothetical protein BF93_16565 [Brachybacterium phenoliresistens]
MLTRPRPPFARLGAGLVLVAACAGVPATVAIVEHAPTAGAVAPADLPDVCSNPSASVSPSTIAPGESTELTGCGFPASTAVRVDVEGPSVSSFSTTSNSRGQVSTPVTLDEPGEYRLILTAGADQAYATVTVAGSEPSEPTDPTEDPTEEPTDEPTAEPTEEPTSGEPTTQEPTEEPTSGEPTTEEPTEEPTSGEPTTEEPTEDPSTAPSEDPSTAPTDPETSGEPTDGSTSAPAPDPSTEPTEGETETPTEEPTTTPSPEPTAPETTTVPVDHEATTDPEDDQDTEAPQTPSEEPSSPAGSATAGPASGVGMASAIAELLGAEQGSGATTSPAPDETGASAGSQEPGELANTGVDLRLGLVGIALAVIGGGLALWSGRRALRD